MAAAFLAWMRAISLAHPAKKMLENPPEPFSGRGRSLGNPATWSSPHSPCALAGYLKRLGSSGPLFSFPAGRVASPSHEKAPPERGLEGSAGRRQAVAVARRLALCWKNSAWLITAETFAGWNGFAIRKAGSGRSPVRKRSG
jgi:hypothetical protein